MVSRLILLRHAQSTANIKNSINTELPGAPLTELGRQQARQAGPFLANLVGAKDGAPGRLVAIVHSKAQRATDTAILVAESINRAAGLDPQLLQPQAVDNLHELAGGSSEGRWDPAGKEAYHLYHVGVAYQTGADHIPGGETVEGFRQRYIDTLLALWNKYCATDKNGNDPDVDLMVVTHGTAIDVTTSWATPVDNEFMLQRHLRNCTPAVLIPGNRPFGQWTLQAWDNHPVPPHNDVTVAS